MPTYEYINTATGEIVEIFKPSSQADPIDSIIRHEGRSLRRIVSSSAVIGAGVKRITHQYPFASNSLPKRTPGCEHDHKGRPIIRNQAHEREILAQTGYARD